MKRIQLPEESLNTLAEQISNNLYSAHFFEQGVIQGEELKNFAEHSQINQFLLFQIFQVWNMQIGKLKHPYFDFDHESVRQYLKLLQNQLSRHIRISAEDFKPLLKKAVFNNLTLLLDPHQSFEKFFFVNQEKIPLELYERYAPFFSDFDFAINSILHYHKQNEMHNVEKDIFFLKLDRVFELYDDRTDEGVEGYRREILLKLTGKTPEELASEMEAAEQARLAELEAAKARKEAELAKLAENERREREEAERKAEALRKKNEEQKKLSESSFFDTLSVSGSFFEVEELEKDPQITETPEPASQPIDIPIIEEGPEEPLAEAPEVMEAETEIRTVLEERPETGPEIENGPEPLAEISVHTEEPEGEVLSGEAEPHTEAEEKTAETVLDILKRQAEEEEAFMEAEAMEEEEIEEEDEDEIDEEEDDEDEDDDDEDDEEDDDEDDEDDEEDDDEEDDDEDEEEDESEGESGVVDDERENVLVEEEEVVKKPVSILDKILGKSRKEPEKTPDPVEEKEAEVSSLLRQEEEDKPTIHDTLAQKTRKIRLEEIPIHKQYQYVQKVFSGNNVRFRIILDKANAARDKDELESLLNKFVLNNPDVDKGEPMVMEFVNLLRQRF